MKKRNKLNSVFVFALVLLMAILSFSASSRDEKKGLVAWWTFDETEDKPAHKLQYDDLEKGIKIKNEALRFYLNI